MMMSDVIPQWRPRWRCRCCLKGRHVFSQNTPFPYQQSVAQRAPPRPTPPRPLTNQPIELRKEKRRGGGNWQAKWLGPTIGILASELLSLPLLRTSWGSGWLMCKHERKGVWYANVYFIVAVPHTHTRTQHRPRDHHGHHYKANAETQTQNIGPGSAAVPTQLAKNSERYSPTQTTNSTIPQYTGTPQAGEAGSESRGTCSRQRHMHSRQHHRNK
jgi:hypothetical protein